MSLLPNRIKLFLYHPKIGVLNKITLHMIKLVVWLVT